MVLSAMTAADAFKNLSVQAMRQDRISDALLPSSGAPAPRIGHALLWTPSYVRDDKILWHVPFLFWLLEATRPRLYVEIGVGEGVAYMAVCQALHRMRAHSQCYAVGQWQDVDGNIHVPERLAARNADLYEDFSSILTDGLEQSAQAIEDGSVDLMLVNLAKDPSIAGPVHEIWLPKLSSTGILLLNGISRDDPAIGALVDALSSKSPTFQMPGGDGLLVVLPGPGSDEDLANIAALKPDDPAHKLIVQMFTRLGAGAYHEVHAREDADHVGALDEQIRGLTEERDALAARLQERELQYDARHRKVALLQARSFDFQLAAEAVRTDWERAETEKTKLAELLEQERAAHLQTKDIAEQLVVEVEARLGGELAAERANREKSAELLQEERAFRKQASEERDRAAAEAEGLQARVAELASASKSSYRMVKTLVAALEESENLLAALTEELRSERQKNEVQAPGAQPGSGGLLGRITGRKRG